MNVQLGTDAAIRILTYSTDASDVVAGQDLFVVAEADDELGVFVSLAALRLTVSAVQLHLDLALAVTLHHWPDEAQRGDTGETYGAQKRGQTT